MIKRNLQLVVYPDRTIIMLGDGPAKTLRSGDSVTVGKTRLTILHTADQQVARG